MNAKSFPRHAVYEFIKVLLAGALNLTRSPYLAFVALVLFIGGCGYSFQGGGSILPPDVRRIYIPFVENHSSEAKLTALFTEALRDRFERFGVVTIVDEIGQADAVLRARILRVVRDTSAVTSVTDQAVRYDTTMTIAAELKRVSGPVLWREGALTVTRSFGAASGAVVTSSAEFFGNTLSAADLAALGQQSGSREVARGQESEAFNFLAERAAQIIYDSSVAPDF